jgi:hypothetical protein
VDGGPLGVLEQLDVETVDSKIWQLAGVYLMSCRRHLCSRCVSLVSAHLS